MSTMSRLGIGNNSILPKRRRRPNPRVRAVEALEERSLLSGLVSYWTADGTAADAAGTNHGTLFNGATYVAGQVGQAFRLDGIDDRISVEDSESLEITGSLSIEAWVFVESFGTNRGEVLFRGDDRSGKDPYQLCTAPDNRIIFSIDTLDARENLEVANVPSGRFLHVAATLDDSTGSMRIYLNGVLAAEKTTALRPFAKLDPSANPGVGIGNHGGYPGTTHSYPFHGLIDELKLYDKSLAADEVLANYEAGAAQQPSKFYVSDDAAADALYSYDSRGSSHGAQPLNNAGSRGVVSNVTGDRLWVIDANKTIYIYDATGNLLGSWSAGGLSPTAQVEGVATNGRDVWVVDAKSDKVFRYAGAASRLSGNQKAASSFSLGTGNKTPKDIVTDGASLWVVDDSTTDNIFKYSLSGSLLGSWSISSGGGSPTGITLDPSAPSHLWIVDNATDRVYQYDNAVGRTSGSQAASTSFALAAGNTNPQGIADPPVAQAAPASQDVPRHSRNVVHALRVRALDSYLTSDWDEHGKRRLRAVADRFIDSFFDEEDTRSRVKAIKGSRR